VNTYRLIKIGELQAVQFGRRFVIPDECLREFLERHMRPGEADDDSLRVARHNISSMARRRLDRRCFTEAVVAEGERCHRSTR
jgi:hypothetical protein